MWFRSLRLVRWFVAVAERGSRENFFERFCSLAGLLFFLFVKWRLGAAIVVVEIVGTEVCGQCLKALLFITFLESEVSHFVGASPIQTLAVRFW